MGISQEQHYKIQKKKILKLKLFRQSKEWENKERKLEEINKMKKKLCFKFMTF